MVREITAKTILSRGNHGPDPWFGGSYEAMSPHARELGDVFERECAARGVATKMRMYQPREGTQTTLW